jgi:hypothetical protein
MPMKGQYSMPINTSGRRRLKDGYLSHSLPCNSIMTFLTGFSKPYGKKRRISIGYMHKPSTDCRNNSPTLIAG